MAHGPTHSQGDPWFFRQILYLNGTLLGSVSMRKVVVIDASKKWATPMINWHINHLEMIVEILAFKEFPLTGILHTGLEMASLAPLYLPSGSSAPAAHQSGLGGELFNSFGGTMLTEAALVPRPNPAAVSTP